MNEIDGELALRQRVSAIDADFITQSLPASRHLDRASVRDAKKFIGVLEEVVSTGDHNVTPVISSADADDIIAGCRLIQRLASAEVALVTQNIDGCPQYWISTGKPPWVTAPISQLSSAHFIAPRRDDWTRNVKPFGVGLFTSTGFQKTQGMWRLYLDLGKYSSNFPKPWRIWKLDINATATVCNIATAAQWEGLVINNPMSRDGLVYPDWEAIAEEWDAVHITVSTIAAIQGMRLRTSIGLIAPSYWDVETTFWLRWSFTSATLVETLMH